MVGSSWQLSLLHIVFFVVSLAASDPEPTIAQLLAENAALRQQLKAAESSCTHNSTFLPSSTQLRDEVELHSRSRFLSSEGHEGSSEAIVEEESEVGHEPGHEPGHEAPHEGGHEATGEGGHEAADLHEEVKCLSESEECTPEQKADEIRKMMGALLLSMTIMLFIVFTCGLVLALKWKDADVRRSVYRMISTFLSIFCAIFINRLACDFLLYQILPCPLPFFLYKGGLGIESPHSHITPEHKCGEAPHDWAIGVFLVVFFLYHVVFTIMMFQSRPATAAGGGSKTWFYVAGNIGGHLRGFAAVASFGVLQQVHFSDLDPDEDGGLAYWKVWSAVILCWLFFVVVRVVSKPIRQCYVNYDAAVADQNKIPFSSSRVGGQEEVQPLVPGGQASQSKDVPFYPACWPKDGGFWSLVRTTKKAPTWSNEVAESEDESCAVCLGFLIMQSVCYGIFEYIPPVEEEDHRTFGQTQRNLMMKWEGFFFFLIILLVALPFALRKCLDTDTLVTEKFGELIPRAVKNAQRIAAMAMCWMVFKHGNWFWRELCNDMLNPKVEGVHRPEPQEIIIIVAIVGNAAFLTVASLVLLILLDLFGDMEDNLKGKFDIRDPVGTYNAFCDVASEGCPKFAASLDPGICGRCFKHNPNRLMTISSIICSNAEKEDGGRTSEHNPQITQQQQLGSKPSNEAILEEQLEEDEEEEAQEDAEGFARELMQALGFLTGICWEKAFSEANSVYTKCSIDLANLLPQGEFTSVHKRIGPILNYGRMHPLASKYIMGLMFLIIVLVTWVKYLVPYARIGKAQHNYLSAAEDFGCNHMTIAHSRAVANNMIRQFSTTPEFRSKLKCACGAHLQFDRKDKSNTTLRCSKKSCPKNEDVPIEPIQCTLRCSQ